MNKENKVIWETIKILTKLSIGIREATKEFIETTNPSQEQKEVVIGMTEALLSCLARIGREFSKDFNIEEKMINGEFKEFEKDKLSKEIKEVGIDFKTKSTDKH